MTEKEFWQFMEKAWRKGRAPQVSGVSLKTDDPRLQRVGRYIGGHSVLPEDYAEIPVGAIAEMGALLSVPHAAPSTKEAVMMLLAHHGCDQALEALREYMENADPGLEIFAELALQECLMWNEERHARGGAMQ
jgi:hypothetical protein